MIYTVTLNPSIDYVMYVNQFKQNTLNRVDKEAKFPGGKGINVSRILKRMNVETKAIGFVGGFTGDYILKELAKEHIHTEFISVNGDSRINIKLKAEQETEINGKGPDINERQLQELLQKIRSIPNQSILILSGSIPSTLPSNLYEKLTKECSERGVRVVVDASGKALQDVVAYNPFLIKPNHHELGELFGVTISTVQEAVEYGKRLVDMGAQNVIVSMAGEGAVLITKEQIYFANVPKGKVMNSVGAGDSLVAGFMGTYYKTGNLIEAFRFGVASGSATAFSTDLATVKKIEELVPQVDITRL